MGSLPCLHPPGDTFHQPCSPSKDSCRPGDSSPTDPPASGTHFSVRFVRAFPIKETVCGTRHGSKAMARRGLRPYPGIRHSRRNGRRMAGRVHHMEPGRPPGIANAGRAFDTQCKAAARSSVSPPPGSSPAPAATTRPPRGLCWTGHTPPSDPRRRAR